METNKSNNNGHPDTIRASVSLFSLQHPTAIVQEGTFVFTLFGRGERSSPQPRTVAQWRVATDSPRAVRARTLAGPAWLFELSLLDAGHGNDVMPMERADLVCRFEPADGSEPIHSAGVRTIQIGRRMTVVNGPS